MNCWWRIQAMLAGFETEELRCSQEIRATEYRFENYLGDDRLPSIFPKGEYGKRSAPSKFRNQLSG